MELNELTKEKESEKPPVVVAYADWIKMWKQIKNAHKIVHENWDELIPIWEAQTNLNTTLSTIQKYTPELKYTEYTISGW